jgi:hypothetical protein
MKCRQFSDPWAIALAAAIVMVAPTGVAAVPQQTDKSPAMSGAWVRNVELSQDGAQAIAEMQKKRRSAIGGGMGGRGAGRGGGRGGGGRDGMDPAQMEEMRASMAEAAQAPAKLNITVGKSAVAFVDAGVPQAFATTNKKEKHTLGSRAVETKTKWDDGRLIKEVNFDGGLKRTETYELLPGEKRQLQLTLKIEGGRIPDPITVKSIYDDAIAR